mgnify:FL=1
MLLADGFSRAFIGIGHRAGSNDIAVYDYDKCAKVLMRRDGMTEEEAYEFLDFNVVGSYVGDLTPIFVERVSIKEVIDEES